jgi:hypothetical protein
MSHLAARFFHNDWLLECCCDFLIRHLSLENYTAVITLADKYWLGDLRWDIFRFIGENLQHLTQQEKFYPNLSILYFGYLYDLLGKCFQFFWFHKRKSNLPK